MSTTTFIRSLPARLASSTGALVLFVALMATNLLRLHAASLTVAGLAVPRLAADIAFGAAVALLAASIIDWKPPRAVAATIVSLALLFLLYVVGLLPAFSFAGAKHAATIAFSLVIFLFCHRHAHALVTARSMPVLLIALVGASLLAYPLRTAINPHTLANILAYLLLVAALIPICRSGRPHAWVHGAFLVGAALGIVYGFRTLAIALLLAIPLYWAAHWYLRRWRPWTVVAAGAVFITCATLLLGDARFAPARQALNEFVMRHTGDRILSGRQTVWNAALARIGESPWLGNGPGAAITTPGERAPSNGRRASEGASCLNALSPGLTRDCAVLMHARDVLAGDGLLNWSYGEPIEAWFGVILGGEPKRVVGLDVSGREAALAIADDMPYRPFPAPEANGRIPKALARLEALTVLRIHDSLIQGPIPPELGALTRLRTLALHDNVLTGAIPPELGNLAHLEELRLNGNLLEGSIPAALGRLEKLRMLRLDDNRLAGSVPEELAELPRMRMMRLGGNALAVDSSLHRAARDLVGADLFCRASSSLEAGLLHDCRTLLGARDGLAGSASLNWSEDAALASWTGIDIGGDGKRITAIELSGRGLTGRIPPEFGNLDGLYVLNLARNQLSGTLPPELGNLRELRVLDLDGNALSGELPPSLGQLSNLKELWLRNNRLRGSVPTTWDELGDLAVLKLGGNTVTGEPPPTLREHLAADPEFATGPSFTALNTGLTKINEFVDPTGSRGFGKTTHSLFLEVGLQTGMVGMLLVGALFAALLFGLGVRHGNLSAVRCFAATCVLVVMVQNTFEVFLLQANFVLGTLAWVLLGLGAGLAHRQH